MSNSLAANVITQMQEANTAFMDNIAKNPVFGAKGQSTRFSVSYTKDGTPSISSSRTVDTRDAGTQLTREATDIAVTGGGMIPVINIGGETGYVTGGSFRIVNGTLTDVDGNTLCGWAYDNSGILQSNRTIGGLTSISTSGLSSIPAVASTKVSVQGSILNSSQEGLKGAGQVFKVNTHGLNAGIKAGDIIVPEDLGTYGALAQGTTISLKVGSNNPVVFTYGGISASKKITLQSIYGSNTVAGRFNMDLAATPNKIMIGSGITVTVAGKSYNFEAQQNADSTKGQFDSLGTLGSALEKIAGLKVKTLDGRLYVSNGDANFGSPITFRDYNLGLSNSVVAALGLQDTKADDKTFSTLDRLQALVNRAGTSGSGIKARIEKSVDSISVNADNASSALNIVISANNPQSFSTSYVGALVDGENAIRGATRYTVSAANNGLNPGDWVSIKNSGNPGVPDGNYVVTLADRNDFTVNMNHSLVAANYALPGAAHLPGAILGIANGTWQKIPGAALEAPIAPPNGFTSIAGGATIRLDFGAAHGLNADDIVYISGIGGINVAGGVANGNYDLPDGYYKVVAVGGPNNFTVTPTSYAGAGAAGPNYIGTAAFNFGNVKIQRMAANANVVADKYQPKVMTTAAGDAKITLNLPSAGKLYKSGDYISFKGLPDLYTIGGIPLKNNTGYLVSTVVGDTLTFESGTAATALASAQYVTNPAGATDVGADFCVDYYGRFCNYMGISDSQTEFKATYVPGALLSNNLSNLFSKNSVWNGMHFNLYDSLGSSHQLQVHLGKLADNKWAVEIAGEPINGIFDYQTTDINGMIAQGEIEFNSDGTFASASGSISQAITISPTGGSAPITFGIDWTQIMQQSVANSKSGTMSANGNGVGIFQSLSITNTGDVLGQFSGGLTKKLYFVPLVVIIDTERYREEQVNETKFRIQHEFLF
jgi:hypothetical protein